jgi:hypothetical protein
MYRIEPQEIFLKGTHGGVVQDKKPPGRFTTSLTEPTTATTQTENRQKHHGSEKRKTAYIGGRILPHLKTRFLLVAKQNGWSPSHTLATAVEEWLEYDLGEKMWVRIAAKIDDAVDRAMQKHSNREARISLQSYYSGEQGRIISINVLRFLLILLDELDEGGNEESDTGDARKGLGELPLIIAESQKQAWANMKRHVGEDQP